MTTIDDLGGWPKILQKPPQRPHAYLDQTSHDKSDEPHNIELHFRRIFGDSKNIYAVFSAFIEFHKLGLYPPKWALDHMVDCLEKHMRDPDLDLFASRMGVVGHASGATNPYERFKWHARQGRALMEMKYLRLAFEISLVDAARSVIEKFELEVTPKRLTNICREDRVMRDALDAVRAREDFDPLKFFWPPTEAARDDYIKTFPRRAQHIIRKKMPNKR